MTPPIRLSLDVILACIHFYNEFSDTVFDNIFAIIVIFAIVVTITVAVKMFEKLWLTACSRKRFVNAEIPHLFRLKALNFV